MSEKSNHDCLNALKKEVATLKVLAKQRVFFYASGGKTDPSYYLFEEKELEWKKITMDNFDFPILAQYIVIQMNSN